LDDRQNFGKPDAGQPFRRCSWATKSSLETEYHDFEWGVPLHDDRKLFEFLLLEGMQAGLSWVTILKKRDNFREAFDSFDPEKIASYTPDTIARLLTNPGIIRNKRKIEAAVHNARAFIDIGNRYGCFDVYIWQFVNSSPICNSWKNLQEIPSRTKESEIMSRDLAQKGFRFVGPTVCYAFMQAVGMVNDHTVDCFRYCELKGLGK
jgi:DNA-3-methyladenine glycosylase I